MPGWREEAMTTELSESSKLKKPIIESDVEPGYSEPKSPERLAWEKRVVRCCGSAEHKQLIEDMKRLYETQIVTKENCINLYCTKPHPHNIKFWHPVLDGEDYIERWKKDR